MTGITLEKVKELREKTQAGMMDCKKALAEAQGDMEGAVKYLREKGLSTAAKRADRSASQGMIAIKKTEDSTTYAMVELNAETDFVARNEKFQALLNQLLDHVIAKNPADIAEMENQSFSGDESKKVQDLITDNIAVIGENIVARRFARYEKTDSNTIAEYTHMNNSIGVLVEFSGTVETELGKDIAMHIAAANPSYINRENVTAVDLENEKEIFKQQALNEGKPENIAEKIVLGKMNKFYEENCLLEQGFVKDPDKKVSSLLPSGVTVTRFDRFQLGA